MTDATALKQTILKEIDATRDHIIRISETLHSYAEVGTKEFKSSKLLCDELESHGFTVERGVAELPTAFRASLKGKPGPSIAFLAEYDALPEMGHGCGHNIIGTSATFAAISMAKVMNQLNGTVVVLGTPDEEGYGGKIPMLQRGAFDGMDAVIENHPDLKNAAWMPSVALGDLVVELEGKEAHYATPQKGANALDAAITILTTLNVLGHGFRPDVIFGYTLSCDAITPIIVPSKASMRIAFKATDMAYLKEASEAIKTCVYGLAKSIGVGVKITDAFDTGLCFEESIPNMTMIKVLDANFKALKVKAESSNEIARYRSFGSTDYGNVSKRFPGLGFSIAITDKEIAAHTPAWVEASISTKGHEGLITATKVMAMTAVDLLASPETLRKATQEFEGYKASNFTNLPLLPVFG
jgi:amidohydrolase